MVESIVFHSARPGAGKSMLVANIAALLAARGRQVGVVDTNLQEGDLTLFFGLPEALIGDTLNDFLLERCDGRTAAYDVTPALVGLQGRATTRPGGRILLLPASPRPRDLAAVINTGFQIERMTDDLIDLAETLRLDTLLIDTHAGLQDETLLAALSLAVAQTLALVLRLDQNDYQGTGVTIDVARTLKVPHIVLVANQVAALFDPLNVKRELEQIYEDEVAALLPYSAELAALGSAGLFVLRYPDHPVTQLLDQLADALFRRTDQSAG
jgi:MinD-like ATPase involved in chromosome partitioning or flagellar assembly